MSTTRTIAEINDKIARQKVTVWTVAELKARVAATSVAEACAAVDVITTGTFEPVESAGAVLNLGHTDPPIKIRQCWIDGVPAYAGLGAVDLYLGATAVAEGSEPSDRDSPAAAAALRGGGHAIEDLIAGRALQLRATGHATHCYPRASFETTISRGTINQFLLFNPRNLYQNFIVGGNAGDCPLYTYLGPLQPNLFNAVYSNPGAISPLFNDPNLELIGLGTRIFLGGGIGYITGEGTQHFPNQKRLPNGTPVGPAATLGAMGDAKQMDPRWVRGCYFRDYGPALMLGIGIALPALNEDVIARAAVRDEDVVAPIVDFSIPRRVRPTFGLVTYAQLKSGKISIEGKTVRAAPLASIPLSLRVAEELREWILAGKFELSEPVAPIARKRAFLPQDRQGSQIALE